MKRMCSNVIKIMQNQIQNKESSDLLHLAIGLEEIALKDKYFVDRKLYPNVDFYTGIVFKAIGFLLVVNDRAAEEHVHCYVCGWKERGLDHAVVGNDV
jgi:hypothetical protein